MDWNKSVQKHIRKKFV